MPTSNDHIQDLNNWGDLEALLATEPEAWEDDPDVAPVQVVPPETGESVRKLTRSGARYRWRCPLFTTDHSAFCESPWEVKFLRCIDACTKVTAIVEQPFWIHYEMDGRSRRHAPDAFVVYENRHVIFEVKERREAESLEIQGRTQLLTPALARLGYVYRVVTEEIIDLQPRLGNVEWLLRRGRMPVSLTRKSEVLKRVADSYGQMTWAELKDLDWELVASRMVLEGLLVVDLHDRIAPDSVVLLGEGGKDVLMLN